MAAMADWNFRQTAGQFARPGYQIAGELTAEQLPRVASDEVRVGTVRAEVQALPANTARRPGLTVVVQGVLGLTCQSCGAAFDQPVQSETTICVARDAAELEAWEALQLQTEAPFESIEAQDKTSALELVEDELLLSVPYVPRCPECAASPTPRIHEFA